MQLRPPRAAVALLALGGFTFPVHASPQSDDDALRTMREHVEAARALANDPALQQGKEAFVRQARERVRASLERADAALDAGDWLLALRPYVEVCDGLGGIVASPYDGKIEDADDLARAAGELRERLDSAPTPLIGRKRRPAALQAALEDARATASTYLVSVQHQSRETSLRAGVYYLDVARSKADLAERLQALECAVPSMAAGPVPGLAAYLDGTEEALLERYRPPLTQDRHSTFIALSAGLKFAREMHAKNYELGALALAIRVRNGLGSIGTDDSEDARDRDELRAVATRWRERLAASPVDVSLPTLWLHEAERALSDDGGDVARAARILERGLVDYFACFEEPRSTDEASQHTVTVTLVRWPFT